MPRQRSGVQMCVSVTDDILYVHGGYSKEKVSGQKKEGRVHEDMYVRYIVYAYCTVLYCTVLYCTVLYCIVLFVLILCMHNNNCVKITLNKSKTVSLTIRFCDVDMYYTYILIILMN